ncbi:hypothetical protein [Neobacillus mesonae]|uniref:DUF3168 domain-containing protein n=1 Tax=Neobacillus mesonae TaxID=1193713 RepID=A0A3T0HV97_9BACI|nr:hypothetical protein [Neobacillus mesonae]AZU61072.1 hypothetical protein CHR53_07290 [Neobacillus mesonae]
MTIEKEIESIYEFIKPVFPSAYAHFQKVPTEPVADELSIRYLLGGSETETSYHYRLDHDYQIIYFAEKEVDCISKLSELEQLINSAIRIPLIGTDRYMSVERFGATQPFRMESGVTSVICVLTVQVRQARPQATDSKINNVNARFE